MSKPLLAAVNEIVAEINGTKDKQRSSILKAKLLKVVGPRIYEAVLEPAPTAEAPAEPSPESSSEESDDEDA